MGDVPEMTGSTESEFVPRMLGSQWKSFGLTYAYVCAYLWNMDMDIRTHDIEVVKSSREGQTRKVIEFKIGVCLLISGVFHTVIANDQLFSLSFGLDSTWCLALYGGCWWLLSIYSPLLLFSVQFSSVAQSCPTLCDPMNHSTSGLPVHHQLLEFTQIHVH